MSYRDIASVTARAQIISHTIVWFRQVPCQFVWAVNPLMGISPANGRNKREKGTCIWGIRPSSQSRSSRSHSIRRIRRSTDTGRWQRRSKPAGGKSVKEVTPVEYIIVVCPIADTARPLNGKPFHCFLNGCQHKHCTAWYDMVIGDWWIKRYFHGSCFDKNLTWERIKENKSEIAIYVSTKIGN